jgi:hypothetical protein
LLAGAEAGAEERDRECQWAGNDEGDDGEDPTLPANLAEEFRRDQRSEDERRSEFEAFGDEFAEVLERRTAGQARRSRP